MTDGTWKRRKKFIRADNEADAWFDFFIWLTPNAEDYLLQLYKKQNVKELRGKIPKERIVGYVNRFLELGLLGKMSAIKIKELK